MISSRCSQPLANSVLPDGLQESRRQRRALHFTTAAKPAQTTQLLNVAHHLWNMFRVCVCVVYGCVCTCVSRYTHLYVHTWRLQINTRRLAFHPPSSFLKQSLSLTVQSIMAARAPGCVCHHPSSPPLSMLRLQHRYLNQLLCELCGSKLRSSGTSSEHFTHWTVSPGPEMDPSM